MLVSARSSRGTGVVQRPQGNSGIELLSVPTELLPRLSRELHRYRNFVSGLSSSDHWDGSNRRTLPIKPFALMNSISAFERLTRSASCTRRSRMTGILSEPAREPHEDQHPSPAHILKRYGDLLEAKIPALAACAATARSPS